MHPAYSVIAFTTASGAGYGLLALLGVLAPLGLVPADRAFAATGLVLALALVSGGLLSSTAHLGHPERAWRAFSQFRSSWLSREGVASVVTYVPALLFALGWVILGRLDGWVAAAGLLAAIGAGLTVVATSMIYASLKPIAEWHSPYTTPAYLIFAGMTGLVLLNAMLAAFGVAAAFLAIAAMAAILAGWAWKTATWRHDDEIARDGPSPAGILGLSGGTVRSVEWPHTERNYVLKEMGYRIARKHETKLRRLVHVLAFALPFVLIGLSLAAGGLLAAVLAVAAALLQAIGMVVERWLFFAGATHTVTLYYR